MKKDSHTIQMKFSCFSLPLTTMPHFDTLLERRWKLHQE